MEVDLSNTEFWLWSGKIQMFQDPLLNSSGLIPDDPPGFKYFTAVKKTDYEKPWPWGHLLRQSTWERDHVTDTPEVRSHVGVQPEGHEREGPNPKMLVPGELMGDKSQFLCVFILFVCVWGSWDWHFHIFISVCMIVWWLKYARMAAAPLSPAELCTWIYFPGDRKWTDMSALEGPISSDQFWTLAATWTFL